MHRRSGIRRRSRRRRRGVALSMSAQFSKIISREGPLILLVAGKVKVEIQAGIGINSLLLKGKPPRNSLSTSLGPQSSYNFIPLSNQSYLLMKVPTQSTTLLNQAFRRVYGLGGLTTSPVQQHYLIAQFIIGCT